MLDGDELNDLKGNIIFELIKERKRGKTDWNQM
jgi:hypothetical protein